MPGSREPASRLYAIADAECLGTDPRRFADSVAAMVRGGVRLLQLRLKPVDPRLAFDDHLRFEMIERTLEALDATRLRDEVQLWLDDRADVAALFPGAFAGVHVGQTDLPPSAVKRVAVQGDGAVLVGLSCHDVDQIVSAESDPDVDWVAIGPVFATSSKVDPDPVVGLDVVQQARAATAKPVVAIGGIDADRVSEVLNAGADAAVVLSALLASGSEPRQIEATACRLTELAARSVVPGRGGD